jgi:hypothetical protein
MRTAAKVLVTGAVVLLANLVSGCGERSQVVVYKSGKYQGKTDSNPWDSAPGASLYTPSKWTAGDKTSWETAIRTRSRGQNEYNRTE